MKTWPETPTGEWIIFIAYACLLILFLGITIRGHTVAAVCNSFQLAKDCGFKVVTHMMPDLPNMGRERDLDGMREYFENPNFRSDGLKIYPTLVIRGEYNRRYGDCVGE